MKPGAQVIYILLNVQGKADHPDCMHGFITSDHRLGQSVYVHFWKAESVSVGLCRGGATLTDSTQLVPFESCAQSVVDRLMGQRDLVKGGEHE